MAEKILIITPLFQRGGSGAATYYQLLNQWLKANNFRTIVLSEWPPSGGVKYGIWPARSGKSKRFVRDLFLYGCQNLTYIFLPLIVLFERPKKIILHSSFFNFPNILIVILAIILSISTKIAHRFLIDCRDSGFSEQSIRLLSKFDLRFIACSLNVKNSLIKAGVAEAKISHIPVPHQVKKAPRDLIEQLTTSLGLTPENYIAYAGLIKEEKKVDLLVDAFRLYKARGGKIPYLVLAGLMKDSGNLRRVIDADASIIYVGNLTQSEVSALYGGAALAVNASPIEGMPRSSLEAMSQGVPVILPPNVPEFVETDANLVAPAHQEQLCNLMFEQTLHPTRALYDVERHDAKTILPQYLKVLI